MANDNQLVQQEELQPFYRGLEGFVEQHLWPAPPTGESAEEAAERPKIFADPIEGYVTLTAWQVAVVDTSLFQRLRGIRQLGFAYLVYPTLGYTRFEHTLGVLARLEQVLGSIRENMANRQGPKPLGQLPSEYQHTAVRLAATCHDLGHCMFSHVSEDVMVRLPGHGTYPSAERITRCFSELAGRTIPLAEILSASMLCTEAFARFLRPLGIPYAGTRPKARRLARSAAHLILGLPIPDDPASLFLAQMMNSGLDIDKLDYMLRESHLSGISLGISLGWLLKKLSVFDLPHGLVPHDLQARIRAFPADSSFYVLSLDKGGQFAFEEFCIARLTLHEKIYLHQKIRAAEADFKRRIGELHRIVEEFTEVHRWLYLRESMLDYPELTLPTLPPPDLFYTPRTVRALGLHDVGARRLLFRAYAFGWQSAIAEPMLEERGAGTDRLMEDITADPERFCTSVGEEYDRIVGLLTDDTVPGGSPAIVVDPPRLSTIQQGHGTLHFDRPSRLPLKWTMPIDRIVDYYHRNKALGYVFASKPHVPIVLLAAEMVAWRCYKVAYVQDGFVSDNVSAVALDMRQALQAKGYYDDARLLQPMSRFLGSVEAQRLIAVVAKRLASYESRTRTRVSPASVAAYVSQFPPDIQNAALHWLLELRMIEPTDLLRSAVRRAMEMDSFSGLSRVGLCPLGAMPDSASRMAYDLRDVGRDVGQGCEVVIIPLSEALAQGTDGVILFDDNANTGLQALNILASWLGVDLPARYALREEHVAALAEGSRVDMLSKPVALAFAVATESACNQLEKIAHSLLGLPLGHLTCIAGEELLSNERVFSGPDSRFQRDQKPELKDFLVGVGRDILMAEGKDEAKAREQALGYGGAEAMIVFPYNCPTMTVTALWVSGTYGNGSWVPLVERARRRSPDTGAVVGEDA